MNKKIVLFFLVLLVVASHAWIFGYPNVGGTIDSYDNNQLDGSRFYLSETANVSNITVYVTNIQNPYVAQVALYSDNGGTPQNRIVNSSSVSPVNGWNVFQIPRTQLSPGYYWIVYNTNTPNANKNNLVYDSSDYNQLAYSQVTVNFGSWPSTFPSPALYQAQYSMYVNYTVNTIPNVSYVLPTPGSYYQQNQTVNYSVIANDSDNYITTMNAQTTFPNGTSVNASMTPLQGMVGGNPAVSGSTNFTLNRGFFGSQYYTVVDLVNPVNETTNLTSWQVYAASSGSVALRVFRKDGGNYDYVGGTAYQNVNTGYNNFSANIQVKTGDLVGFAVNIPLFSSFSISANSYANGLDYQTGDIQSSTLQSSWTAGNYQMSLSVVGFNGSYVYNNFNQTLQTGVYNVTYFAGNALNNFNTSKTYFIVYIPIPANLSIWTQEDFSNSTQRVGLYLNNNSTFYANYTNNSGVPLNAASCIAVFNDSQFFNMSFNSTIQLYTVNRSFSNSGAYSWNVVCFEFPYMILVQNENFTVHNPAVSTDQSSYRNCGSVYYQVNTYNSQGQPINSNLNISILNNLNVTMQQLSVSTSNDAYQGYYLLPSNASSGDWWVNAQTCVNIFQPFMVQTAGTDPWKVSLSFNPDKIHYSTSDAFTTTIFALNLNGEGITGLTSSNLSVAVDSSVKPFTEIGNGYYQFNLNTSGLSVGEHTVNVSTKGFGVNVVAGKSFYVG
jgi:hypothetical protein